MILHEDKNVSDILNMFLKTNKIPNILFHGPSGSGKRTLVHNFISEVYNHDKERISRNTLYSNCTHCKGIKFIREDLKFFAKANVENKTTDKKSRKLFKIIVMSNANELTTDAQSALRRCIEVFNHSTRFFFITENKSAIMGPILSRFCDIYIPCILQKGDPINYHIKNVLETDYVKNFEEFGAKHNKWLKTYINKIHDWSSKKILYIVGVLYERGYYGVDIINYIKEKQMDDVKKWRLVLLFDKMKKNIRCEKHLMYMMLFFTFLRSKTDLENIPFM
jgi:Cdc6-like AAA superfamily ATPase